MTRLCPEDSQNIVYLFHGTLPDALLKSNICEGI